MTKKLLSKILIALFAIVLPCSLAFLIPTQNISSKGDSIYEYSENVDILNGSFDSFSNSIGYSTNNQTGWTRHFNNSARCVALDTENKFGTKQKYDYYLREDMQPGHAGSDDSKILMINSSSTAVDNKNYKEQSLQEYYSSSTISLKANSFYQFQVSMCTMHFESMGEFGSIYIRGIKDDKGNDLSFRQQRTSISEENIDNWNTYNFFFSTGDEAPDITIQLWLGDEGRPSPGVVFFDEVIGTRLSENLYYDRLDRVASASEGNSKIHLVHYEQQSNKTLVDTSKMNFDFENPNLSDYWDTKLGQNSGAKIIGLDYDSFVNTTAFTSYAGSDFTSNNTKALAMWAKDGYVSLKLKPKIDIQQFALYKITAHVKTFDMDENTSFTMTATETDKILSDLPYLGLDGKYNPSEKAASSNEIKSNPSSPFINNYNEVSLYVKGHNKYNSQIELSLTLGTSDKHAMGGVIVDNMTIELVSTSEFSTPALELKVASDEETTIHNGLFDITSDVDKDNLAPVKASDWTITQSESLYEKRSGIISVYEPYFDAYAAQYDWAKGLTNPKSSERDTKVDNVYMMYNSRPDYQSIKSNSFDIESGKYYTLTFNYRTFGDNAKLSVRLVDEEDVNILNEKALSSADWTTYTCTIYGGEAKTNVSLVLEFGAEKELASGYAFIDIVEINESSEVADPKVDLSGFRLNLDPNGEVKSYIDPDKSSPSFKKSGPIKDSEAGIVLGKDNTSFLYKNDDGVIKTIDEDGTLENNVMVVKTSPSDSNLSVSLTSRFEIDTEKDKIYALSFRLLTYFPRYNGSHMHDDKEVDFGASVKLNGFEEIKNLRFNEWTPITIYFNSTEAKSATFALSLTSDCKASAGYAYLTDIEWKDVTNEKSLESIKADLSEVVEADSHSSKTTFLSSVAADSPEEPSTPSEEPSSSNSTNDNMVWILVPTLITALALIIAIVGFTLRHVKFKKADKIKKEEYDRLETLHNDVITNQAKDMQKAQVEEANKEIALVQSQIDALEEENKAIVAKSREEGKVTKEIERKFKTYSTRRAKLQKSIDELNEHKTYLQSEDYLLELLKKVIAEKNKK